MSEENTPSPSRRSLTSPRALNQLGFFAVGSAFMLASIAVTRRSVARKTAAALPRSFQPNVRGPSRAGDSLRGGMTEAEAPGGLIAAQALGLATLNVFSFGVMASGGIAYAFDISSVEDMRRYARAKMYGPTGKPDEAAEKEMEEWAVGLLTKAGFKLDEEKAKEEEGKQDGVKKEKDA